MHSILKIAALSIRRLRGCDSGIPTRLQFVLIFSFYRVLDKPWIDNDGFQKRETEINRASAASRPDWPGRRRRGQLGRRG